MKTQIIILMSVMLISACEGKKFDDENLSLESRLDVANEEISSLKLKMSVLEFKNDFEKIAYLEIGSTSFSPLDTDVGKFTVSLKDVEPFANGSRISLMFGNPNSATITMAKFKIDYGSLDSSGSIQSDTEKTKEMEIIQPLEAASWNTVKVILEGLPANKLGYVRIHDLSISSISLQKN